MRTTPLHERLAPFNRTHRWHDWAGFVVAERYQHSATFEYFAIRNSVALYDTSPLFKHRIAGPDATAFLTGVLARDVRTCAVGEGQYTAWCDDGGFVVEDGVVLRIAEEEYWLTSAEPNLRYLTSLAAGRQVTVADHSDEYAIAAVQGPHALDVVASCAPVAAALPYFGVTKTSIEGIDVLISRTGFTGDLGYEVWAPSADAGTVLDSLMAAGRPYDITPIGMRALVMARLDAAMLLIDADYSSARFAWVSAQRETLDELGLGWMVKDDGRPFIGAAATHARRRRGANRWSTVGIRLDPVAYEEIFDAAGIVAPKDGEYQTGSVSIYDRDFDTDPTAEYVGYATSLMFSPLLKQHIGLAKLALPRGSQMYAEITPIHRPRYAQATVVRTPFFSPARKTADMSKELR